MPGIVSNGLQSPIRSWNSIYFKKLWKLLKHCSFISFAFACCFIWCLSLCGGLRDWRAWTSEESHWLCSSVAMDEPRRWCRHGMARTGAAVGSAQTNCQRIDAWCAAAAVESLSQASADGGWERSLGRSRARWWPFLGPAFGLRITTWILRVRFFGNWKRRR